MHKILPLDPVLSQINLSPILKSDGNYSPVHDIKAFLTLEIDRGQ
jgi:hypothetical protein